MELGFIGTGTMGNAMARCLIDGGHQLTVHDLRREAATNLCEMGARWADTAKAVAEASHVVFLSLPGPAQMEAVMLDPEAGVLAGLRPGSALGDTTTNSPKVFRQVAEVCRTKGVEVLDMPVSGRPPNMTIMVGGDREVFDKHRPVLDCMGKNVFYVGESGAGCTAKLVTQYLGYTNLIAAAEGLLIGAKSGLDLTVLAQIVPVSAGASRAFEGSSYWTSNSMSAGHRALPRFLTCRCPDLFDGTRRRERPGGDRDGQAPGSDPDRAQTDWIRRMAGGHPTTVLGRLSLGAPRLSGCHRSGRPASLS
jgi:3-hydroxyisobutyrate dehydrogenase-like beta-hydroxyacid dehydrogenase